MSEETTGANIQAVHPQQNNLYAKAVPYLIACLVGGAAGTGSGVLVGSKDDFISVQEANDKFATFEKVNALETRLSDYRDQTKEDLSDLKDGQARITGTVERIRDYLLQSKLPPGSQP